MKRITLTCNDDATARLLSAIAEHPLITLTVEAAEPPGAEERETIAAYFIRRGEELQAAGVRNSVTTTDKLAKEVLAGMHRPSTSTALVVGKSYGGGGGPAPEQAND